MKVGNLIKVGVLGEWYIAVIAVIEPVRVKLWWLDGGGKSGLSYDWFTVESLKELQRNGYAEMIDESLL